METRLSRLGVLLLLTTCVSQMVGFGEVSTATIDIHLSDPGSKLWGRYVASDGRSRRAGWIHDKDEHGSYQIAGLSPGSTSRVKGVVYVAGCALQTFDIAIDHLANYQYSFPCEPVKQTELVGSVLSPGRYDHPVRIEAKYVADWVPAFLGYNDGTDTEIPLGASAILDDQDHFRLSIPDLFSVNSANRTPHQGELRIYVRDQRGGQIVNVLRLSANNPDVQPTRFGGIPVQSLESKSLVFAFGESNHSCGHDEFGFSHRSDASGHCAP